MALGLSHTAMNQKRHERENFVTYRATYTWQDPLNCETDTSTYTIYRRVEKGDEEWSFADLREVREFMVF